MHADAVALRDQLNNAPAATAIRLASEITIDRKLVHMIGRLLETAVLLHGATGKLDPLFNDLVWAVVDGKTERAAAVIASFDALAPERSTPVATAESTVGATGDFSTFPFSAVIFDLDQTLIDSSALPNAETRRQWANDRRRDAGLVRALEVRGGVAPHELPGLLRARGVRVAIVTRSPLDYCDVVCKLYGIESDIIVAAAADKSAAFEKGALELGADSPELAIVGDESADFTAAASVGAWSIGALWTPQRWQARLQPETSVSQPARLLAIPDWRLLRYLGEQNGAGDPVIHAGSLLTQGKIHALGRYFVSSHPRHGDPLSRAIIAGKNKAEPEAQIALALQRFGRASRKRDINLIASVPPRSGQLDRFADYRELVADAFDARAAQPLRTIKNVPGYKRKRPLDKQAANDGRFACIGDVVGAKVILLDDVVTTGSVMLACRQTLEAAGAREVHCLAFGLTQSR
jgi:phosphoglycolate phosphatase-like HAD superfamily hydrolase